MSVKLFVLGLVHRGDTHGYEIKEVARTWGIERWARINVGSIYHALGKLQEEGSIVEVGLEQDGNRPPRTVYRITETGRGAFLELLRHICRTADVETREIDMVLAFIDLLPPDERVALLTERLVGLEPRHASLRASLDSYDRARADDDPRLDETRRLLRDFPWVEAGVRHSFGRVDYERQWLQQVIASVASWPARTP